MELLNLKDAVVDVPLQLGKILEGRSTLPLSWPHNTTRCQRGIAGDAALSLRNPTDPSITIELQEYFNSRQVIRRDRILSLGGESKSQMSSRCVCLRFAARLTYPILLVSYCKRPASSV
jgi:hypothetical protein